MRLVHLHPIPEGENKEAHSPLMSCKRAPPHPCKEDASGEMMGMSVTMRPGWDWLQ